MQSKGLLKENEILVIFFLPILAQTGNNAELHTCSEIGAQIEFENERETNEIMNENCIPKPSFVSNIRDLYR